MNELQPLLDLLGGKAGGLITVLTWLGVLAPLSALFGTKFKHWISDKLNAVAASEDQDDDGYLRGLFSNPGYRFVAFLSKFSPFHLPTLADLERAIRLQKEAAIEAGGNLRATPGPTGSILSVLCLSFLLSAVCFSGCGVLQVAPGADPIMVHAEWLAENSLNTIDQFLAWERNNEAALLQHSPGIHAAAVALRTDDSAAREIKNLRTITEQYKTDRSAANGARVKAATNALLALSNSVRAHMGLPPLTLPVFTPTATDLMNGLPAH